MAIDLHFLSESSAPAGPDFTVPSAPPISEENKSLDCPMSHLPVEILSEILSRLPLFSKSELEAQSHYSSRGFAIAQVCRHWRAIVFGSKRLWTVIPLRNPQLSTLALRLSSPAPISLYVDLSLVLRSSKYRTSVHEALHHVSRARDLSLRFLAPGDEEGAHDNGKLVGELMDILTMYPAPWLQTFSFSDTPTYDNFIPSNIFAGRPLPKLRGLKMINGIVPLTSHLLQAPLTDLELEECATYWVDKEDDLLCFGDIYDHLNILEALPALRTLMIKGLWLDNRRSADRIAPKLRSIELPLLERLELEDTVSIVSTFLRHLSLPQEIMLGVTCVDNVHTSTDVHFPVDISRLSAPLSSHFSRSIAADLSFDDLSISLQYGSNLESVSFFASNPRLLAEVDRSPTYPEEDAILPQHVRFSIRTPSPHASPLALLPILHSARTVTVIDSQSLNYPTSTLRFSTGWHDICATLHSLHTIRASGPAALGLVAVLVAQGVSVFRDLHTLELERVGFSSTLKERRKEEKLIQGLAVWLRDRVAVALPVALRIRECNLTKSMVLALSASLVEPDAFLWDRRLDGLDCVRG